MQARHSVLTSCEQMVHEGLPNLLRLYLNPYVAQVCYCLNHYVRSTWSTADDYQTFLANSFDEALSGAIKLARYDRASAGLPVTGLIVDPSDRLGPYVAAPAGDGQVEYVPGLILSDNKTSAAEIAAHGPVGFVVLVTCAADPIKHDTDLLRRLRQQHPRPLLITCVDRASLAALRRGIADARGDRVPDIVVFDESFVDRAVPFSALTARKTLYEHWNRPGKTMFHSTTYQPNTIASLHFVRCLEQADPEFHSAHAAELGRALVDGAWCGQLFRRLYSPSLYRMIRAIGFDTPDVRARGHFVTVGDRRIFDAVSGVACSVRGHNPGTYVDELARLNGADYAVQLAARLRELTGLPHLLPAVSGAGAVENALRIALVAQYPRRYVLALQAGFGGKTLLALTGTANPAYKENINPLYDAVCYVDPFAADAEAQIETVLEKYPVAVVQVELIQAVGGVRQVPEKVLRYLEARRSHWGYLLLVDEVQTGMYRTGPFTLSHAMGLTPDLLLLGKGTSDMMYPFALVLYSASVQHKLDRAGSCLPGTLRKRYGYEIGYKTVYGVLDRAEAMGLSHRVNEAGVLFRQLLEKGLAGCKAVREVRVFGLLIGIELDAQRWPRRLFRKRLAALYLLGMLRHARYPVLAGFCQYEPNVLKITPALTVAPEEIHQVCATIVDVLRRPLHRLLAAAVGGLFRSLGAWRKKHEHRSDPAHRLAAD